jgi:hypothetical protein
VVQFSSKYKQINKPAALPLHELFELNFVLLCVAGNGDVLN